MPIQVLMPALSPTMEKGNLAKWLKREGDAVKTGDVIAEIETDKATMEVEAIDDGTLGKILVPEGTNDVAVAAHLLGHGVAQRFAHGHRDQLDAFGNVGRGDRGARGRFGESGLRRRRSLPLGRLDRRRGSGFGALLLARRLCRLGFRLR